MVGRGSDPRPWFRDPPAYGYGLHAFGHRSTFAPFLPQSRSKTSAAGCARVEVRLPQADAELWVNKTKTGATGVERMFESPELGEGQEYRYELVAKWTRSGEPMSETRSVVVKAGGSVAVDFTQ
ncbi:MAG: TIGR03000 domain-containing protein [Fimbriiglobus sp.]|nr:TIGR03000 domain-containing protein [Fimbriiglobus sp.]